MAMESEVRAEEWLRGVLDGLAEHETPDMLAGFLAGCGIKGLRNKVGYCPIAEYVNDALGMGLAGVWECATFLTGLSDDWNAKATNPDVVERFIVKFDKGDYPELER